MHLEGTTTPADFARIAERNGVQLPADPREMFRCDGFQSFLNAFIAVVRALRTPADFFEITASYLERSAGEGVRHVELMFSPATIRHFSPQADIEGVLAAIHAASEQVRRSSGVSSLVILDMVRNLGEDAALTDIDLALRCREYGVVGVGLGGDERRFPGRNFLRVFDRAQRLGLRRTAHAGEADGAASVVDAIEVLGAERIGHGVTAAADAAAMRLVRERGVTIDVCPTSNRITGAWDGKTVHPLEGFLAEGIGATLNSDDPSFFGASLLDEYEGAAQRGLGRDALVQLARSSFVASFASDKEKRTWLQELDAFVAGTRT